MRIALSLTAHILFLALSVYSLRGMDAVPARYLPVLELLPFALGAASFVLGLRFNRSQLVYSAILFTVVYAYPFWWNPGVGFQHHVLVVNSIAILLPLNLALISFYSERGILTPLGVARLLVILLQIILLAGVLYSGQADWAHLVRATLFPHLQIRLSVLFQPALLAILLAVILIAASYLAHANPFRSAIFGSMVLALYAVNLPPRPLGPVAVLLGFALALPLLTLIRESYRMAFIDELTDIPGRRALNETLHKLGNTYVIAMLDVDHFKKFNDTYGHDAGDDVLRMLAAKLKGVTGGGRPFRYGGEEFCVVFPGVDAPDAAPHLEELRATVAGKRFTIRNQERRKTDTKRKRGKGGNRRSVSVTISIGYAQRDERCKNPAEVLKAADKALYRAKRAGRNRVSS